MNLDHGCLGSLGLLYEPGQPPPANNSTQTMGWPADMCPIKDVGGDGLPFKDNFNKDNKNNVQNIRFRHMGNTKANALFVDGHVADFRVTAKPFDPTGPNGQNYFNGGAVTLRKDNIYVNRP